MIQTVEGRIGGGKTYMVAGWICNHICKGGIVATNINLQVEPFTDQYGKKAGLRAVLRRQYNYELQDCQIIPLSDVKKVDYTNEKGKVQKLLEIVMFYKLVPRGTPEMPILVVVDEAHMHFPQDGYRSIPREVLEFLTLSRHACVDVVFISQHIKNMWCQMFRLAEFRWGVRDMKKYGFQFAMINWPWLFPHFLMVKRDFEGERMATVMQWHKKFLYEIYKSPDVVARFESMPKAARVDIKKSELDKMQKLTLFGGGFFCCLMLLLMPACINNSKSKEKIALLESELVLAKEVRVSVVAPSGLPADLGEQVDVESVPDYAVGFVSRGGSARIYLTSGSYQLGSDYEGSRIIAIKARHIRTLDGVDHYFQRQPVGMEESSVSVPVPF